MSLSIKQASPDWSERREAPPGRPERRPPARHEFEKEREEERPAVSVDSSLEAILQDSRSGGSASLTRRLPAHSTGRTCRPMQSLAD